MLVSSYLSVRVHVRVCQRGSYWMDFREIWYWWLLKYLSRNCIFGWNRTKISDTLYEHLLLQMALQPGVGLGLLYNMPPGLSVPCSVSPFVYTHLSQIHGHVIQPSHSWSSSSSRCAQLSVHLFWDFGVLHSFYMAKPSYSLAFNKPDNVLSLDYGF